MYIVIPTPKYQPNSFATAMQSPPLFFDTKDQLMAYIKTANGAMRIFEATELQYSVDVTLQDKSAEYVTQQVDR